MCFNGKDWFAMVTTTFNKIGQDKVAILLTAYKVIGTKFSTIEEYIRYLESKWGAVSINYAIEAERILLDPK
jgi:hypothetical protein